MIKLHFDGGLHSNNLISYGITLYEGEQIVHQEGGEINIIGLSSNCAEYIALINGMTKCIALGIKDVSIYGDSALVVSQLNGTYKVKNDNMKTLYTVVKQLEKHFVKVSYTWISRKDKKQSETDRMTRS